MRVRELQRLRKKDLAWYLAGFVLVQLGLSVWLEMSRSAVRDADFADLERILDERQAEAPGRPLVLLLGTSRTFWGLRAERLSDSQDQAAPQLINCATLGGGPMMQQVNLRRILHLGARPQLVFVEMMPLFLSLRRGVPAEENQSYMGRFNAAEVVRLHSYFEQPRLLWGSWAKARLLPGIYHGAEFRNVLAIDRPARDRTYATGRNSYGAAVFGEEFTPAEIEARTRSSLKQYASALTDPALATGALQALRDLLTLCRDESLAVVLVMPPEGTAFRCYAPAVAESQAQAVRNLTGELAVPLIDARSWLDDACFYDGHHVTAKGAELYTERFKVEALLPHLSAPSTLPHLKSYAPPLWLGSLRRQ